jgi:methyl-accepting chemotaxis protein
VIRNTCFAILPDLLVTNLFTLGLITVATIVVTLFVSHKIAGPIFRFEKELKEIGQGDLTKKIMPRKKDQITDLADCLNSMVFSLRQKVLDIQTDVKHIRESAVKQNVPQEFIEQLNVLHEKIGSNFKI